jgi:hypothetical protein
MAHSQKLENINRIGVKDIPLNIKILMVMERPILYAMYLMVGIMPSLQKVMNLINNILMMTSNKLLFKKVNKLICALRRVELAIVTLEMFIMGVLIMES